VVYSHIFRSALEDEAHLSAVYLACTPLTQQYTHLQLQPGEYIAESVVAYHN